MAQTAWLRAYVITPPTAPRRCLSLGLLLRLAFLCFFLLSETASAIGREKIGHERRPIWEHGGEATSFAARLEPNPSFHGSRDAAVREVWHHVVLI
jgi:hypothetical protein